MYFFLQCSENDELYRAASRGISAPHCVDLCSLIPLLIYSKALISRINCCTRARGNLREY